MVSAEKSLRKIVYPGYNAGARERGRKEMSAAYEYDDIAEGVFLPIYAVICDDIIKATGITSGILLDIGCGGGHLGLTMLQKSDFKVGLLCDINPEAIKIARARAYEWHLSDRAKAVLQDVHHMDFADNYADLIISRGSMGFWADQTADFQEIYRVLKPGGKTYIGVGLGNKETMEAIVVQMRKTEPDWPKSVKKRQNALSSDKYQDLFREMGFDFDIIDDPDKGRWFIIKKPLESGASE